MSGLVVGFSAGCSLASRCNTVFTSAARKGSRRHRLSTDEGRCCSYITTEFADVKLRRRCVLCPFFTRLEKNDKTAITVLTVLFLAPRNSRRTFACHCWEQEEMMEDRTGWIDSRHFISCKFWALINMSVSPWKRTIGTIIAIWVTLCFVI
jgi:hypothetical protein